MPNKEPIFKAIFASRWSELPLIMRKHYANRPFCHDIVVAEGKMDIKFGWFIKLLSPFLRILGSLVPYQGENIPVTVHFMSEPHSNAFILEREFRFPHKKPFIFKSKLLVIQDDILVEVMRSGLGWKHRFFYDGQNVILKHRGYIFKIFGIYIPLPFMDFIIGIGHAEEQALSDDKFKMKMTINHPLMGEIYLYRGEFEINEALI